MFKRVKLELEPLSLSLCFVCVCVGCVCGVCVCVCVRESALKATAIRAYESNRRLFGFQAGLFLNRRFQFRSKLDLFSIKIDLFQYIFD